MDSVSSFFFGAMVGVILAMFMFAYDDDIVVVTSIDNVQTVEWNKNLYKLAPVKIEAAE